MRRDSTTSCRFAPARAGRLMLAILLASSSLSVLWAAPRAKPQSEREKVLEAARRRGSLPGRVIVGNASWYGPGFHGRRTASGERFNRNAMTLASRSLPFGTRVRVTNLKTGKSAVARVNDRGPFHRGRVVDLSEALARRIGITGVGPVRVEVLPKTPKPQPTPPAERTPAARATP